MAVYCYFDILEIKDQERMQTYRERVMSTVEKFQGRYVVIGGPWKVKDGGFNPVFPVIIEFPDMQNAEAWYDSEDYRPLRDMRETATRSDAVFFQSLQ